MRCDGRKTRRKSELEAWKVEMYPFFLLSLGRPLCRVQCCVVCSRGALGDIIIITLHFASLFFVPCFFSLFFSFLFSLHFSLSGFCFRVCLLVFYLPLSEPEFLYPISLYIIPTDAPSINRLAHFAATALDSTHGVNYSFCPLHSGFFFRYAACVCRFA